MKFKFRLESFFKMVQLREDRKKMELGRSQARLRDLENSLQSSQRRLRESLPGAVAKKDLSLWMAFGAQAVIGQIEQMNDLENALQDEQERRDLHRNELADVAAKRKGLENLREKSLQYFRRERDKKEQKETEDISRVLRRFIR